MNEAAPVRDAPAGQADASFAEITAKRRGMLRRYLYQHPRVMDGVVVFSYALLVAPTVVDAIMSGAWLAPALLFVVAGALLFRRSPPRGAGCLRRGDGSGGHAAAPVGLQCFGGPVVLAVCRGRGAHAPVRTGGYAAATAPLALLYLLAAVGPMENSFVHDAGGNPGDFHLLTSIATGATIALSNVIATGIGISVRQRREHE
ncbi:UNVERIFIED_ORG: hypothetical protein ABIB19_002719 [Arthrobacter sp. UYEF10]